MQTYPGKALPLTASEVAVVGVTAALWSVVSGGETQAQRSTSRVFRFRDNRRGGWLHVTPVTAHPIPSHHPILKQSSVAVCFCSGFDQQTQFATWFPGESSVVFE